MLLLWGFFCARVRKSVLLIMLIGFWVKFQESSGTLIHDLNQYIVQVFKWQRHLHLLGTGQGLK